MSVTLFERAVGVPINYEAEGASGVFNNTGTQFPGAQVSFADLNLELGISGPDTKWVASHNGQA